jgi:DNA-binding NtrC family response regulator
VRILSSSSKDLGQELLAGNFRQDLYFRLNTHSVALPPLRQRLDDLPALASSFLSNHGIPGEIELGPDALERLRQYSWPGNVGELKAVMDHAAQQVGRGMVHSRNLPPLFQAATSDTLAGLSRRLDSALGAWLRERITLAPAEYDYVHSELERMVLRHLLVEYDSKPTALANGLNMNRNTLRKKLQMAGLNQ